MSKAGEELEALIRRIVREELEAREQSKQIEPAKLFYTEPEFCKLVGIGETTAWRLRSTGELKFSQVGRKVLYLPEHVTEFLKGREKPARSR